MNDIEYVKNVVLDLIAKEERKVAFGVIDFYFNRAKTLEEFDVLGFCALKAEYHERYLECAEAAYGLSRSNEQIEASRMNLFQAYNRLNMPEKALFYIDLHFRQDPECFDAQINRAFNLSLLGERKKAEDIILGLVPQNAEQVENIRFASSYKKLREGETSQGIIDFIDTFKPKSKLFEEQLEMTKWTGGPQPGRTIFVNGEGGVGDEIINIRFFHHLKDLGMNPVLYSCWSMYRPDIIDVFKRNGYEVITDIYSIDKNELWTNLMPLPGYLNLSESELWRGPYLTPKRDPKNKIDSSKFKIGIKANGNPYFSQDIYRRIPINELIDALDFGDKAEIYLFDKEKTDERCINLKDRLSCWEDSFDLIDQMDVIVSSCTSLVHAAGAIGKSTVVISPISEYYLWTSSRNNASTPWYGDNFYVAKQRKIRCWEEPLKQTRQIVQEMISK